MNKDMLGSVEEEFTYLQYKDILTALSNAYEFIDFPEGKKIALALAGDEGTSQPLCILRHDIDVDPKAALPVSRIEADMGIQATYFFMVRCPIYNIFSPENATVVEQILDSGHHLGIHFDCTMYPELSKDNISSLISCEVDLLERFFVHRVEVVSFHRPGNMELQGIDLNIWPNTYEPVFREKFRYFSDSRSRWARGNPVESKEFLNRNNLHILVHPIWWTKVHLSPMAHLVDAVKNIQTRAEQYMRDDIQVWKDGMQTSSTEEVKDR